MEIKGYNSYYIENLTDPVLPLGKGLESNVYMVGSKWDFCSSLFDEINERDDVDFTALNKVLDSTLSDQHLSYRDVNMACAIVEPNAIMTMQMGSTRVLHIRPSKQSVLYDSRQQVLDIYSARAKMQRIDDLKAGDFVLVISSSKIDINSLLAILCDEELSTEDKRVMIFELHPPMSKTPNSATIMLEIAETGGKATKINDMNKKWYVIIAALVAVIVGISLFTLRGGKSGEDASEQTEQATIETDEGLRVVPDELKPTIVHEAPDIEEETRSQESEREKEEVVETVEETQPAEVEHPESNDVPQVIVVEPTEPVTPTVPDTPDQPEE
ncbi:MAG: hypothetical protein IK092_00460 [Muribaculaceae bacterium]|nr:hypothetical protein [Muribaculaceae bacterium]